MSKSTLITVKYKCQNPSCRAEDSVTYFSGERQHECINCWKCRGGYGMPKAQMLSAGAGMLPIAKVDA